MRTRSWHAILAHSIPRNPILANPTLANPTLANPTLANPILANRNLANRNLANRNRAVGKPILRNPAARKLAVLAIAVLGVSALAACSGDSAPLTLAPKVDLDRYAGRWYVIANIPYFAEKGNVGSYFDISFRPNDKLTDIYTAHPKTFDAPPKSYTLNGYVVPGTGNARWRESPFWPLYLSYLVLYVDPDYQTALVGYPGRGYGWVLARKPVIDDATYLSLLGRMRDNGYDISQFRRVPQIPAQIGNPGFQ